MPTATTSNVLAWDDVYWLGLRLGVPHGWNCARHSCNPTHGSLVFVDRTRPRLQLTWTATDAPPTVDRLLDDYRRRTLAASAEATDPQDRAPAQSESTLDEDDQARTADALDITIGPTQHHADWAWVTRCDDEHPTLTRMVRVEEDAGRLVEITLVHGAGPLPGGTDFGPCGRGEAHGPKSVAPGIHTPLVHELAERAAVEAAPDSATRWRLLGLDVATPPGWRPRRLGARPGDVALHLTAGDDTDAPAIIARRQSMTSAWFDGNLDAWLKREHPDRRAALAASSHPDFTAAGVGDATQPRYERWIGRRRHVALFARHDAATETLLSLRVESPARDRMDAASVRVQPCNAPPLRRRDPRPGAVGVEGFNGQN